MKFSDFRNTAEMLAYFGLSVEIDEFIDFNSIDSIDIPEHLKQDIRFVLSNRGNTDMEFYACEFLISPLLKEAWKRNPKAKLYSHPQIKYEDLVLVPDYVVAPRNKTGVNIFEKPLLVTVEAKNDDYERGWSDIYRQLIVARFLNENNDIPIYALVSIGDGWQVGKLDGKIIYKHPYSLGLNNANQLLGVLDFIFADCVRTAEKFNMY
ncbi:MAG: hypothetical protein EAZ08_00225 [Cytophagales bacterium]|nr:MAG: hypothetical protein EAZ08_00225 [Cytophagales bacterium]